MVNRSGWNLILKTVNKISQTVYVSDSIYKPPLVNKNILKQLQNKFVFSSTKKVKTLRFPWQYNPIGRAQNLYYESRLTTTTWDC